MTDLCCVYAFAFVTYSLKDQLRYNLCVSTDMVVQYGDGASNTVEENSSVFSLIRMC